MFRKTFWFSIFFITSFGMSVIYFNCKIENSDKIVFVELKNINKTLRSNKILQNKPSEQNRKHAQKDLWIVKNGQRKHYLVNAEESNLQILCDKQMQATESLDHLQCSFLEDEGLLTNTMQAQHGTFNFRNKSFEGENIVWDLDIGTITAGIASLHHINSKPTNEDFTFENEVCFTSKNLASGFSIASKKAILSFEDSKSQQNLPKIDFLENVLITSNKFTAQSGKASYENQTLFLIPEDSSNLCKINTLDDPKISIQSKTAKVIIENLQPKQILLEDNIEMFSPCIQNRQTFAIADILTYDPTEQKFTLKAKERKRVLVWQEGISLSAPEVFIHQDKNSHIDLIEGKGDVRLTFSSDEKNIIDTFLSKYIYE